MGKWERQKRAEKKQLDWIIIANPESKKDQKKLVKLAKHADSLEVIECAIDKVTDQIVLADFAKNDTYKPRSKAAIKKITDQNLLADISLFAKDWEICENAIKRVIDENILIKFAKKKEGPWESRLYAVKKIQDQRALIEIAKGDDVDCVRLCAVKKITDTRQLLDIVKSKDYDDQQLAPEILKKLNDQKEILEFIDNVDDSEIRGNALNKINDENIIADYVMKENERIMFRKIAYSKLKSKKALIRVEESIKSIKCSHCNEIQLEVITCPGCENTIGIECIVNDSIDDGSYGYIHSKLCPLCSHVFSQTH